MQNKAAKFENGINAEMLVSKALLDEGYIKIAHRYKTKVGEIDLIFLRGKELVFVEVKSRKDNYFQDCVSSKQIERIFAAGEMYINDNSIYKNHDHRYDLVLVCNGQIVEWMKGISL